MLPRRAWEQSNFDFGAKVEVVRHDILSLAVIEPFLYNPLMSDKLPNPHDLFFKSAFTRAEIVTGFIKHYLPEEITSHIDLDTVSVDLESYVSREFKEYFSDVVAQIRAYVARHFAHRRRAFQNYDSSADCAADHEIHR